MCDPVTALMAAGTAISTVGTLQAGSAAATSSNYNAQLMEQQAEYEQKQADDAIVRGSERVREIQRRGAQTQGTGRAAASAGNVDINFGSPLDILLDNARNIETDVMRTQENARREAEGLDFQAQQTRSGATLTRLEGQQRKAASRTQAFGQVLSGGAQIYKYRASVNAPSTTGRIE